MTQESSFNSAIIDILAGTFGGIGQTLVGHPFDTIKVRLQTQQYINGKPTLFKGPIDCVSKTISREGFRALYRGSASPLFFAMFHNSNLFFWYGIGLRVSGVDSSKFDIPKVLLSGAIAGSGSALTETVMDLFKIKMQGQIGEGKYKGVWDCASQIYKVHGIRGMFHGFVPTLLRDSICFPLYFMGFEGTMHYLNANNNGNPSLAVATLAGGVAGFLFWGILYPLEMVKTRLQYEPLTVSSRKYHGVVHCFTTILKEEGFASMWRGYVPCLLRAIAVNSAIFLGVTYVRRRFVNHKY
eukprot:TRINITY_DN4440_c0_g1_i1.p1 TRINITY_DN4440_c0_g1~~TRINITY_DN4440_c0_g1_i1.p1  ORF type:complete len:297 (-),score=52.88 TRINITY_DN4440_c0_g1_i1:7-897(-)